MAVPSVFGAQVSVDSASGIGASALAVNSGAISLGTAGTAASASLFTGGIAFTATTGSTPHLVCGNTTCKIESTGAGGVTIADGTNLYVDGDVVQDTATPPLVTGTTTVGSLSGTIIGLDATPRSLSTLGGGFTNLTQGTMIVFACVLEDSNDSARAIFMLASMPDNNNVVVRETSVNANGGAPMLIMAWPAGLTPTIAFNIAPSAQRNVSTLVIAQR